jgi:hypothetical protein
LNYAQLQARAEVLARLEGWTDVSPAPDWATLVQRAWDWFAWDSEAIVSTETLSSVNGTVEYTLAGTYKTILDVEFGTAGLLRSEESFERNLSPSWRRQSAVATPSRWVRSGVEKISLLPPPNGVTTVTVRGTGYGTALSAATDVPAAPTVFHEAIAIKAAVLQGEAYSQGEGSARLAALSEQYEGFVKDCRAVMGGE